MNTTEIVALLKSKRNPTNVAGMAKFGIGGANILGISVTELRKLAKKIGTDHKIALELWDTEIHEARILASIIDDAALVTDFQMEKWVSELDSWDICDQLCGNLFGYTAAAMAKAVEWTTRTAEFEKRAGFVMMAAIAVHRRDDISDAQMLPLLQLIRHTAPDTRNFVKKAINWALRQIGKRSPTLTAEALLVARELARSSDNTLKWIGGDALRELQGRHT